jgi:hypothetical protein
LAGSLVQPVDLCYNSVNERVYTANRQTYNLSVFKDTIPATNSSNSLLVYPNPTKDFVTLSTPTTYELFAANGALLDKRAVPVNRIDLKRYPAGTYVAKTTLGTIRIIKL